MKKLVSLLLIAVFIPTLLLTGCREYEDEPTPVGSSEFEMLQDYVKSNDLDLTNVLDGWITAASGLTLNADNSVNGFTVFDFRGADDFNDGHIAGAINVTLANMLDHAATASDPILCVCYSGQTAARATGLLRMAGYTNAKSLKWGMCGWNTNFAGSWNSNAGDYPSPNWVDTDDDWATMTEFDVPSFSTGEATGADILAARVQAAIAMDWKVTKTDVLDDPSAYFVNNKWTADSYNAYGHVDGAYRIDTPEGLGADGIKYLDSSETVVTYCYTGQTSSITTAWLQVMGVDSARSMLFGANGIVLTDLLAGAPAKAWGGTGNGAVADNPWVTE